MLNTRSISQPGSKDDVKEMELRNILKVASFPQPRSISISLHDRLVLLLGN